MNFNEIIEKMRSQCLQGDPVNEWDLDDLKTEYNKLDNTFKALCKNIDFYISENIELKKVLKETENSLRCANLRIMELEKTNDKLVETYHIERLELIDKKCTGCIIVQELKKQIECYKTTIADLESKLDDDNDYDKNIEIDQTDLD